MKKALYVGSFDPVTLGHMDVIKRAANMFGLVTVAVGDNPNKKYMFSFIERVKLLSKACELIGVKNVMVEPQPIKYLTADYARIYGYDVIIKGARTSQDFDYEKLIHEVSLTQQRKIETVLLFSSSHLGHVSSSAVKELSRFHGLMHEYVPIHVKAALEAKNDQRIIGITGTIGSGKTSVSKRVGVNTCINMDTIAHDLMGSGLPLAIETRDTVKNVFGTVDRKELGKIVFADKAALQKLNEIYREPMLTMVREKISGTKGTILLEGALLTEMNWLFLCNNRVILVKTPSPDEHRKRLSARGYTDEQINRRLESQYTFEEKKKAVEDKINQDKFGNYIICDTEATDLQSICKLGKFLFNSESDKEVGEMKYFS